LAARRLQLLPSEQVLVDIRPHWSFLSAPLAVALAVAAAGVALDVGLPHTSVALHWVEGAVVAVPCLWLAARLVRWRSSGLVLTSIRLVTFGVGRRGTEVRLADIDHVEVDQAMLRRLVGTGSLEVVEAADGRVVRIEDVRKPAVLQRIIIRRLGPPPGSDDGPAGGSGTGPDRLPSHLRPGPLPRRS
jgi:membrane protein YdbS with pleckstrin-like domain